VYIMVKETPDLPTGKYYHFQLLGMTVVDENGYPLGILTEIIETGANDVYLLIDETGKEILLPAIEQVVLDVDIQNRLMRVRPQMWE
jgi:16S rRNA processing protein RimM